MRNKTNMIRTIIDNPEGGTIVAGAGIRSSATDGFFVGGHGKPFIAESVESMHQGELRAWLDALTAPYVGWWTDSDDGRLYVDGVDWIESELAASQLARARKEIAIWDIGRERELRFVYVEQP